MAVKTIHLGQKLIEGLLPLVITFAMRKMGGGGMMGMGVGKSKAKVYIEKETGVTFKDVAGEEEAKAPCLIQLLRQLIIRHNSRGIDNVSASFILLLGYDLNLI
mgnify:CR=1 FL=1